MHTPRPLAGLGLCAPEPPGGRRGRATRSSQQPLHQRGDLCSGPCGALPWSRSARMAIPICSGHRSGTGQALGHPGTQAAGAAPAHLPGAECGELSSPALGCSCPRPLSPGVPWALVSRPSVGDSCQRKASEGTLERPPCTSEPGTQGTQSCGVRQGQAGSAEEDTAAQWYLTQFSLIKIQVDKH